jgi:hypothetical protein
MDFLELVENVRVEEADAQRLLRGDGDGARSAKVQARAKYTTRLAEATELVAKAFAGNRRAALTFQEAMSTSDFPLLFADILDRQLLQAYREAPQHWPAIAKRAEVRDFRNVKRFPRGIGGGATLDGVAAGAAYPESSIADSTPIQYAVSKYGRRMPFDFETLINDDLDALKDVPERFGRAARMTEEKFVTELYVDSTGPHASVYTGGNGNIITGNPALSLPGLQTAMGVLAAMTDGDGNPIVVTAATLVVPPALKITAQNIMNAIQLELAEAGGTANQKLIAVNWMRSELSLVVNPWIPIVASSANGDTSWFLFADAASGPAALEIGFLRGYSEPQVFVKSPNQQFVGGGTPDVMAGDFDTDAIQYKVRHILGGVVIDASMSVGSEGDGS